MKIRIVAAATALALVFATTSCMTTYDAYGRPVQSVDPGLAVAGVAAAALVGYALAEGDDYDDCYRPRSYYRPYHGGYSGCHRVPVYDYCPSW